MNTLKIGTTTITWEGPEIKRWTKSGKDRLYLERSREFIDLTDEESVRSFDCTDSYGWNTERVLLRDASGQVAMQDGHPVKVARIHRYRKSVIEVRWLNESAEVQSGISNFFAALAQFVEQEMTKSEEVEQVESVEVSEEPVKAVLVELKRPFGAHHLDPVETVFQTCKTATRPFTIEDIERVLLAASPNDEDVQDIARGAARWVQSFENSFSPANRRILQEVGEGVFALR